MNHERSRDCNNVVRLSLTDTDVKKYNRCRTHSTFKGRRCEAGRAREAFSPGPHSLGPDSGLTLGPHSGLSLGLGGLDRPEDVVGDHELGTVVGGEGLVRVGVKGRDRARARARAKARVRVRARVSGLMNG